MCGQYILYMHISARTRTCTSSRKSLGNMFGEHDLESVAPALHTQAPLGVFFSSCWGSCLRSRFGKCFGKLSIEHHEAI